MKTQYTEEQLDEMPTHQLRRLIKAIEDRVGGEIVPKRCMRDILIDAILEDQEEKGGSGCSLR
jgi:hypothetical protein